MLRRKNKWRTKRTLAVSTVVANLLMIALTLSLGAILVAWAGTTYGGFSSGSQLFFAQRGQALQERLVIENVFFNTAGANHTIMIFVRNVGVEDIKIVAIYANSTSLTTSGGALLCPLPVTLGVGLVCEFNVNWPLGRWASGSIFNLVVTTARGNRATFAVRGP